MFGATLRCKTCYQYTPDRCICGKDVALKGIKNGNCNRLTCQHPGATWFNKGSAKYYCSACANSINQSCPANDLLCFEDLQ